MKCRSYIRAMSLFLLLVTVAFSFSFLTFAEKVYPPEVENVDAVCVFNKEHGEIAVDRNMHMRVYPASTVKLMTALVAIEHFEDTETTITVTQAMLDDVIGRNLKLTEGEKIRVVDLLHALLCGGYNDAAIVLAHAVSGSVPTFCEAMDQKARALGAVNTHYTNPTGLHDDGMYTTAYDTALIGFAVMENTELFNATKRVKYTIPATNHEEERTIYNRNALITTSVTADYYDPNAEGMNAGGTDEGGDCVVTAGNYNDLSWVCVVMGGRPESPSDETNYAYIASKKSLRYALVNYKFKTLRKADEIINTLPVRFSATEESVNIVMDRDLSALLHSNVDAEHDIIYEIVMNTDLLSAPFEKDAVVGEIRMLCNGVLLDQANLITQNAVDSHGFLVFMYRVKQVTGHPIFILFLLAAIGGIGYFLWKRFPGGPNKQARRTRNRYF